MRAAEFASLAASMLDTCCRAVVSQDVTNPSNCSDFAANFMASECAADTSGRVAIVTQPQKRRCDWPIYRGTPPRGEEALFGGKLKPAFKLLASRGVL
jgi:hypothetical protein